MLKNHIKKLLKKIPDLFSVTILGAFFIVLFQVPALENALSQNNSLRVKSHPNFNLEFSGQAKVIDGDSIKVGKKEVRLVGIDAPEYSQNCFDDKSQEYSCGKNSREFLLSLINKKQVQCFYAELDKYNRYLAKCFIEGDSINEKIIENGWAVIYNFEETDEKMVALEKAAQNKKIGIWRGAFELPKEYRRKNPRSN